MVVHLQSNGGGGGGGGGDSKTMLCDVTYQTVAVLKRIVTKTMSIQNELFQRSLMKSKRTFYA